MSRHGARVTWRSDGAFASGDYSRAHDIAFDGGQTIRGSSSPAVVPAPRSDPYGVDPEEALVASVAACHMLWFLDLARQAGLDVLSYADDAQGEMGRIGAGRYALTRIVLRPAIAYGGAAPSAETVARLHHDAHQRCFIANSLKTQIVVEGVGAA